MPKNKGELFDLKNIEQAQKLIEQINKLVSEGAAFTSNGKNIAQYAENISKVKDLYSQLDKLSNSHFEKLDTMNKDYFKQVQEQIKLAEKSIQLQNEQIENEAIHNKLVGEKTKHLEYLAQVDKDMEKFNKNLDNVVNSSYERAKKDLEKEYEKLNNVQKMFTNKQAFIDSRLGTKENYVKKASAYLDTQNTFSIENKEGVLNKTEMTNLLKEYMGEESDFGKGSSNLSLGSKTLNLASNTLKDAANTILGVFKQGLTNQTNAYENTFTNISVRTGLTRDQYYDNQWDLNNQLSSLGLNDNIRSSEVQQMWNSLADTGMSQSDILERALDNVITNKIVPYLDTTSQDVNLLNNRLDGNFIKDIRGINKANLDMAGNNYITQDLLNTIIAQVQPMSDEALQNLTQGSEEMTSYINSLMAKGIDRDTALSYATQYFKAQRYGDQMLSSGTTSEKMFMTSILQHPELNLYDLNDANNIMGLAGDIDQFWATQLPGYNSSLNGVITNSAGNSVGTSYERMQAGYKMNDNYTTFSDIANQTDLTPEQAEQYANQATQEFTAGNNQTTKELQSVTLENFMNELSVTYEKLGLMGDVFISAIEGLGNLLITWLGTNLVGGIIGKGIGALSGLGSAKSTGGLFASLGAAGPIGLGIAGVGATVAAFYAWDKATQQKNLKNDSEYSSRSNELYNNYVAAAEASAQENGTSTEDIDYDALYGQALNDAQTRGNIGIWKNSSEVALYKDDKGNYTTSGTYDYGILSAFTDLDKETRESFGLTPKALKTGGEEAKIALDELYKNKDFKGYNSIKTYALRSLLNNNSDLLKSSDLYAALSITYLLDNMNQDSAVSEPIKEYLGYDLPNNKDDIQSYLDSNNITEASRLLDIYNMLGSKDVDFYLATSAGSFRAFPTEDELKQNFNLHRQGLDEVPYDDYPALLHQGEAVLTASTANELRNLTDTYRETATQSYNIDAIIQNQTSALITKMDEIIRVITTGVGTPETQNTASNKLYDAMRTMSSTKAF